MSKGNKLYVKWKGYYFFFNNWINKKDRVWVSKYILKPKSLGGIVKDELDLSNYATKSDLKNATGVDTSNVAKKVDLASLKWDFDKLHIDKLEKN